LQSLDVAVQDIVEGVTPARCQFMNGFSSCPETEGTYCARVHDIFPPQGNSGVSNGVVYIESGPRVRLRVTVGTKTKS
jgi:hypothetical protein